MKIVVEIGLSHEGSLGRALAFIDAVAWAGADAVKFQCHDGDPCNKFRDGTTFPQDATRQVYWERTAFGREQWATIAGRASDKGLEFGCSVFAPEGFGTARGLVDFWKIPSSRVELAFFAKQQKQPIIVSDGWATEEHMATLVDTLTADDCLCHCISQYPCDPTLINLHDWLCICERSFFKCQRGISDHSGTIWPSIQAAALGFDLAEVHVCMSRHDFGPDVSSSITIEELKTLVEGVRFIEAGIKRNATRDDRLAAAKEVMGVFG